MDRVFWVVSIDWELWRACGLGVFFCFYGLCGLGVSVDWTTMGISVD